MFESPFNMIKKWLTSAQKRNSNIKALAGVGNGKIYDENGEAISISSGPLPEYTGAISGLKWPTVTSPFTQMQNRMRYTFTEKVPFRGVFVNYYLNANGQETPNSSAVTFTGSWEYPIGTAPVQLKWAGATSITVPPGGKAPPWDELSNPPDYNKTGILTVFEVSAGTNIVHGRRLNAKINEENRYGNGTLIDQTMAGSSVPLTGGSASTDLSIEPVIIFGTTSKRTVLELGDSKDTGASDNANGYTHAIGNSDRMFEECGVAYSNAASPSTRANQFVANSAKRLEFATYFSDVFCGLGDNDLNNGSSDDQLIASLLAIANLPELINKPFYISTKTPYGSTNDSMLTTAGQSPYSGNATKETYRRNFNTKVRSGAAGGGRFAGYVDFAAVIEHPAVPGVFQVSYDPLATTGIASYYTPDCIHENERGNNLYKSRRISFVYGWKQ